MHIVVYLDVLFGVNLLMNGIVLACMKLFLREKTTWLRCFLASLVGAGLYCIVFFLPFQKNSVGYGVYFILTAALMVKTAFCVKKWRKWAAYIGIQYGIASVLVGLMNGIYYGLRTEESLQSVFFAGIGREYQRFGTAEFLVTAFFAGLIFYFGSRAIFHKKQRDDGDTKSF